MTALQEKKGRSIQSRLILLLLLILIPVLIIQAYIYYDSYQTRRASELQANLEIARALAKTFESFVQDVIHQELAIGLAITSSQPMTFEDITRLLETSRDYVAVRDFTWLNPKGVAVYSSNPDMIGKNYSDRSYFRYVTSGRVWMVSELIIAKTTGEAVFGISRGIRNGKGALLGIVFAAIIPEKLDARLAVERSKGGGYAIVDNKGMLVYRYPAISATWEERNWLKQYPEFEEALKGKEIATTVYAPFEGKNRLVGFTPVSSIGWAASAGKKEEDVTWPILISIGKSALLFLSVLIAAFLVALAVSRKITSPVTELRAHALALGHGKVPEQVKVNHILELQDLAEAFNTMAEKVQARELDLRESERRERERAIELATHLNAAPTPIIIVHNREGTHITGNRAAEELLGLLHGGEVSLSAPAGVRPRHYKAVKDERELRIDELPARRAARGEEVRDFEYSIVFDDGTIRHVMAYGAPLFDDYGQPRGAIHTLVDITERKQSEEALKHYSAQLEEANKELESFSYSVSHDLRAPLRAIDGYARLILKKQGDKFDEDTLRRFKDIRLNAQMMGKLIDDLLTFSRLSRKDISRSELNMVDLIREEWKTLININPDRNMSLIVNSTPLGYGDVTLIKQVYHNLLSNAVKFTRPRDYAQIEVGGYNDGNENVFYVKDNGVGFDMKFYDKLFSVFQRLHNDPDYEGTGVGLATVQRIVHKQGGRVWAEGKEGEGATFYFSLPPPQTH
ncbi:MAG TPA: ATP-binding protein [Syntrophales bacterium]|nr:ATP-binding protein [Syntrophales bacterium]